VTLTTSQPAAEHEPSARVAEILAAACRVIARDGAHGLHMKAVAREAGVSKALVHYYFATRQELLRQAMAYADGRTRERVEAELEPLATGRERLERMLVAYAASEPLFAESHALWNAAWGSLRLDEELAPAVRAGYRRWAAWISSLVEEGREDGSMPGARDTRATAIALTALADGLSSLVDTGVVEPAEAAHLIRSAIGDVAVA
jgi:AcrR family transcriptional regulator